jgi:predicted sulfurtransferase
MNLETKPYEILGHFLQIADAAAEDTFLGPEYIYRRLVAVRDEYEEFELVRKARTIPCDECEAEIPYTQIIECSHCDARVCSKCLVEHAKGHSQC